MSDERPTPAKEARKRRTALQWLALGAVAAAVLVVLALGLGRWGVLSPAGRDLVSTFVNGKSLGRYGRINVYGLHGDLWSDFTLDRVTVTDRKGVWLDARKVRVDWSYLPLVSRRFHADLVSAEVVQLIRRPELEPEVSPPGPMPLAIDIDRVQARIELLEGFSKRYGRWTVAGDVDLERAGEKSGTLEAHSVTRPGDYLRAKFDIGGGVPVKIDARGYEAEGGPLSGSLGYPADRPFSLDVHADDTGGKGLLHAVVKSGDFTPLTADGRWTANGGYGKGEVDFSASELLKPFAERIGRRGSFRVAMQKARGGLYGAAWVFEGENLTASAKGAFDPKTGTSKDGISIETATASLTRLAGSKIAGPGRFTGVWKGDPYRWTLKGDVAAAQATLDGYGLRRVSGPVALSWNNGRYDADAKLSGDGGAGQGVLAGLLGTRPVVQGSGSRLPDGRVLIKRFDATGAGVKVSGTGSRDLFGGLSFKGDAAITNLGAIRKGASGSLSGPFRASQAKGKPWKISLDARGRNLVTGLGQLDRLLGREPRLQAAGALGAGRVLLDRATLNGAAGRVDGKGAIGFDGKLGLGLNWNAKGPFQAGPVEIAGNAKGNGSLSGSLGAPRIDLKSTFDEIALPQLTLTQATVALAFQKDARGFDGRIAVDAAGGNYGPAHGRSAFRFTMDGVRLDDLAVNAGGVQANGSVALRKGAPSSADLTFAAGPGAFLAAGTARGRVLLTEEPTSALATVDVTGTDVQPRGSDFVLKTLRLKGEGTLGRLPFALTADVAGPTPGRFNGTGVYSRVGETQTVALNGAGRLRGADFRTLQPLVFSLAPNARTLRADLTVGSGRLTADARQSDAGFDARANLAGVDLAALGEDVAGRVDASLVLQGRGAALSGTLDAKLAGAHSRDAPRNLTVDGTVKAQLAGDRLHVDATASDPGGMRASTTLNLPVVASAAPLRLAVARTRPMDGRFAVEGEIRPIWNLLLGGDRVLSGQASAQGTLAGTINEPLIQGNASVRSGRFDDAATGLTLRNLTLDARFDRNIATFSQFAADDDKGGKVSGGGKVDIRAGGGSSFTLALRQFQMIDNDMAEAKASGPITITRGADGKIKLVGDLRIDRAEIAPNPPAPSGVVRMDVVEVNLPAGRTAFTPPKPRGPGVALDVKVRAPGRVFVRGRGLDAELSVDAHVGGTTDNPDLTGVARVVRGDFEFAGRRFVFDESGSITLSTHAENIRLDLRAVRDDPNLTAAVLIRGTASKPEVTLTSTPSLPQDEILSQILFGRSASQLSSVEGAQLASSVASLAGGGGLDVLGNLRELAGLDRLTFGGDEQSGLSVAGGKYISEKLYLELINNAKTGPAAQIQWRVKRKLSIISQITGQGDAKLAVRWRKDFR